MSTKKLKVSMKGGSGVTKRPAATPFSGLIMGIVQGMELASVVPKRLETEGTVTVPINIAQITASLDSITRGINIANKVLAKRGHTRPSALKLKIKVPYKERKSRGGAGHIKKDPDAPKRAPSAYNLFMADYVQKHKNSGTVTPAAEGGGEKGKLFKNAAEAWKTIDGEKKREYEEVAKKKNAELHPEGQVPKSAVKEKKTAVPSSAQSVKKTPAATASEDKPAKALKKAKKAVPVSEAPHAPAVSAAKKEKPAKRANPDAANADSSSQQSKPSKKSKTADKENALATPTSPSKSLKGKQEEDGTKKKKLKKQMAQG
ncbi:hypothetical protein HK101_010395 [Irineochytrium annulatum]|nr:hypothetical protein HK101_010395 [Irineochytrium annulatum]